MIECKKCKKLAADNAKLKKFAREFIYTGCWGYDLEIDSEAVQERAEQCGLIESHPATKKDCETFAEHEIEVGDEVFMFTDVLKDE